MERINISKMIESELEGKKKDNLGAKPVKPEEFKLSTAERLKIQKHWKEEEANIKVE